MINIATSIAHHHPHFPPPSMTRSDGSVIYHLRGASFSVKASPDGFCATLRGGDKLGCPTVEAIAATPEAAVSAALRDGDHILAAAVLNSADQALVLLTVLGTSLPATPSAAEKRVDHARRLVNSLRTATEAAQANFSAAQAAKRHAETMINVEAALPGLTGPAHADRVAVLRALAPSGWHKVNGNRIRWLVGAGLVDAHKVVTAYDRNSRPTASFTQASITDAGRAALRALDPQEPTK